MGNCIRKEKDKNDTSKLKKLKKSKRNKKDDMFVESTKNDGTFAVIEGDSICEDVKTETQQNIVRGLSQVRPPPEMKMVDSTDTVDSESNDPQNDSITLLRDSPKPSPKKMNIFNSPKPLSGPRVLFKSPLPKHLAFRREKNNSTSSLYIKDTINSPNVDEIIRCMSVALLYHIKNGFITSQTNPDKLDDIFSERNYPLTRDNVDLLNVPDVSTIYRYINLIFRIQKLPPECAILCLCYIERVLSGQKIVLHPENWRRIVFGSIIIATKVWEDESVWNIDFLDLFPLLTLVDLNNLENRYLELLQFNVLIVGSEYAKYYFELRALSQFDSFPLEPLNKELQSQLEERSQKTNEKVFHTRTIKETPRRSRSVDFFDPKSPPAVLQ
jgi:hypothetical protein